MSRWLAVDAHFQSDVSSLSLPSLNLGPGTELRLSLRGDVTMEKADRGYEKLERQEGSDFRALPTSNKTENQKINTNGLKEKLAQNVFFMSP